MKPMTKQEWLEAFIKRAGFSYGWENLESWARRMAEQAYEEHSAIAELQARLHLSENDNRNLRAGAKKHQKRARQNWQAKLAMKRERDAATKWFGEVMAIMHADGGHYLAKHGAEKAALDAVTKYHELHFELNQALKGRMNICIPTDAMEQEFANHYRRGLEDGRKQIPESLLEIARRLAADRKKNNHFTADPIYTVQRESRIYHVSEDDADGFVWIEDGERCPEDFAARLERRYKRDWQIPDRFYRCGYIIRWEFVDAYLSYDAAKERVEYENRKHNGLHRTYVESGCRNHEWKALQAWLLQIAAQQTPKKEPT